MLQRDLPSLSPVLTTASLSFERMSSRRGIFVLCNMPGLNSFFLTVFLFHFIEVEAKHKIPQCLIELCDHRLLWTLELELSITVLKVSPGG